MDALHGPDPNPRQPKPTAISGCSWQLKRPSEATTVPGRFNGYLANYVPTCRPQKTTCLEKDSREIFNPLERSVPGVVCAVSGNMLNIDDRSTTRMRQHGQRAFLYGPSRCKPHPMRYLVDRVNHRYRQMQRAILAWSPLGMAFILLIGADA